MAKRTLLGADGATRHWRVQVVHAQLAQARCMVARLYRFDRRHIDEQAAGAQGRCCTLGKQGICHHSAMVQQGDDDIRLRHGQRGRAVYSGTEGLQALGFGPGTVPHVHFKPGFTQTPPHGIAHQADSEYCYFHCVSWQLAKNTARTMRQLIQGAVKLSKG